MFFMIHVTAVIGVHRISCQFHYSDFLTSAIVSHITSLTIVYWLVFSNKAQIKDNIKVPRHWPLWEEFNGNRWIPLPVNSPHKGPVTRKMFPFDDVIMYETLAHLHSWQVTPGKCRNISRVRVGHFLWRHLVHKSISTPATLNETS